ncbi:MAG: FtsW/RodA/SpoVE family cell cycle protein [Planctomycetota bacterium]
MQSAYRVPRAQGVALGALAAAGVLLAASGGATPAAARAGEPWLHAARHAAALLFSGWVGLEVARRRALPPRWGWAGAGLVALALVLTLVPGVGVLSGGARRGVGVGRFVLQPSVVLAALAPTVCARWLPDRAGWLVAAGVAACGVCALQPNFAHLALLLAVLAASAAGAGRWRLTGGALGLGAGAGLVALAYPYVRWRIASFLAAGLTADTRALSRIVDGAGPWGAGLGQGVHKRLFSSATGDYAFAVGLEELGVVGAAGLAALLACAIASLGLRRAAGPERARAWGTAAFLAVPALLHAGVALRLIPVTGVHFPLLSVDPSATLAVGLALGLAAEPGAAVSRLALARESRVGVQLRGLRASVSFSRAVSVELQRETRA